MILNTKEENIKIKPSQKWKVHKLVSLKTKLNTQQDLLPFRHMAKKMVIVITEKRRLQSFK